MAIDPTDQTFLSSLSQAERAQVIDLQLGYYRIGDPGAADPSDPTLSLPGPGDGFETDRGIVSSEVARWSNDGTLIITGSKADGRFGEAYPTRDLTGNTAHLRLWTADGELLWDRARSRGPDKPNGRPNDQPSDGEDEFEAATFSRHVTNSDRYVAAAGEDDKIEVWEIRDASGNTLAEPILARTLFLPAGRQGSIDGMEFSATGEFLVAGTETGGNIEIWRATGDASTWEFVGTANHGGAPGFAVNAIDFSDDDGLLASAGQDTNGVLWRVNVTRDGDGVAQSVDLERLATMSDPLRSTKGIEFTPGDNAFVAITGTDYRTFIYETAALEAGDATPVQVLSNAIRRGADSGNGGGIIGANSESLTFSNDGRFLVIGSGPNRNFPFNDAGYESSFMRLYETAEITRPGPEPDPIFVQPTYGPEDFNFNPDDTALVTGHEDGTLRRWDVTITGAKTIAAEAFNERTQTHDRWTLSGSLSTEAGDNEWGVTTQARQAEIDGGNPPIDAVGMEVLQDVEWAGHRGSRYLAADNLQGETHRLTLNEAFDASGYSGLQLSFAAAAQLGTFEAGDFLRLIADVDGDGTFEATVAEFSANADGDLALGGTGDALDFIFQDFIFDLDPLLAADPDRTVRFAVEANTDASNEEIAFDSLRITGTPDTSTNDPIGEVGTVTVGQPDGDTWLRVDFSAPLDDPAVVMGPVTFNGSQPTTVRVRNVEATGFEFQFDEWDYLDGFHVPETVSWLAVEQGVHTVDGVTIEAGSSTVSDDPTDVALAGDFGAAPVVVSQLTTANQDRALVERLSAVDPSGFTVQLDAEEAATSAVGAETLSFIAVSGPGASVGAGTTGNVVTHNGTAIALGADSSALAFFADMQTRDGGDPSTVRIRSRSDSAVTVFIEEEASADAETNHTTEVVGWLTFEEGLLFDSPLS